jgi:phage terminase large subunit-like protein
MLAFRTKLLNRFVVNEKQTWFTTEDAARLLLGDEIVFTEAYQRSGTVPLSAVDTRKAFDLGYWRGNEGYVPRDRVLCCMAFDLSVHDDFSAVSYAMRLPGSGLFFVHTDYYFPEGALKGHANAELYKMWHDTGHLTFCKGDVIDVEQITEDIMTRSRVFNIVRIGYDAYKAQLLVNNLYTLGGKDLLVPFSQTMGNFNKPVETFEMFARATPPRIKFNNNPINTYCLTNCVISEDTMENKKPMKISQTRKIDGTISALMAFGLLMSLEF